ncbi:hypothetical protein AMPC_23600 [Anaeromyxobacter paludicola]|uniref:NHL repeat containing protein n=2 Tax=Anaeromyxobacter paludicola TaxID=2918171 RepID=A0ABM7XBP7_9BACT|nr:hypothetical protein AMPC_23600 [Anaeromyxobacter paludicola]
MKNVLVLALLAAAPAARAELAFVSRGPVYADSKNAPLKAPEGVGCADGTLVVADTGNGRLVSYEWRDGVVSGGTEIKLAQVTHPVRVQLDGQGNLLVLDRKAKKIARLDPKGAFQGWLEPKGAAGVVPQAFKLDAAGDVWVLDQTSNAVLALDPTGALKSKVELPKGGIFVDLTVDAAGTVYALDARGAEVWSVEKGGAAFKLLSKGLKESMNFPAYLTHDGKGTLLVVDQNGMGVVLLGIDGSYLGRRLALGWTEGAVYYPAQLCLTPGGEMVVADRGNNRVDLFSVTR